jgi:hypothetical protein
VWRSAAKGLEGLQNDAEPSGVLLTEKLKIGLKGKKSLRTTIEDRTQRNPPISIN